MYSTCQRLRLAIGLLLLLIFPVACGLMDSSDTTAPASAPESAAEAESEPATPTEPEPTAAPEQSTDPPATTAPEKPTDPPATAAPPDPTVTPALTAMVTNGGNLRSEPQIVPETVLAQVCPGDEVMLLEQQQIGSSLWYHIRLTTPAPDCVANHAAQNTEGWLSSTLLSEPIPAPVADAPAPETSVADAPAPETSVADTPAPEIPADDGVSASPDVREGVMLSRTRMRDTAGGASSSSLPQACPSDTVAILEEQNDGSSIWMHIRITGTGEECAEQRAGIGTEGWVRADEVEEQFHIPTMIIGEWESAADPTLRLYFYDTGAMYMRSSQSEAILTGEFTFVDDDSIDLNIHVSSFASGIFDVTIQDDGERMRLIAPDGNVRALTRLGPPPPLIDSGIGPVPPPFGGAR